VGHRCDCIEACKVYEHVQQVHNVYGGCSIECSIIGASANNCLLMNLIEVIRTACMAVGVSYILGLVEQAAPLICSITVSVLLH